MRFSIVRIQPKFKKICQIFTHVQVCGQKYRKMFLKLYFHILACSQIWLNLHVDHQHFGYITKLTKRNTDLRNEDAKLDRYKHTKLETLNFDSSLVVKGFLSFQSQYINIIYNLFKRHEVLKNSMDKLQNLISKNIYVEFFQFAIFSDRVQTNLCKVQVTLNWDILSSIHRCQFSLGLN